MTIPTRSLISSFALGLAACASAHHAEPAGPSAMTALAREGAQLGDIPAIEFDVAMEYLKRTPQNDQALDQIRRACETYPSITLVRVEGHTDADSNEIHNQRLSEARAQSVVDWLTTHGVERGRLHPIGCASRVPLFRSDTPEHKARNRRVEVAIETIDGAPADGAYDACTPNPYRR